MRDVLERLLRGEHLSESMAAETMTGIMEGQATDAQIAGFAVALAAKGETAAEIAGCARAMRGACTRIEATARPLVDTCGTGGDGRGTFNISTTAAFVVAGVGLHVAKHGNRSATSRCGSAEVLEALGLNLGLSSARVAAAIDEVGIGFLYAPALHGSLRHAAAARKELGVRTIFNLLGPLTNPAGATRQVIGVPRADLVPLVAEALSLLGTERALIVHGAGGTDELTLAGVNQACEVIGDAVRPCAIDGQDYGLGRADLSALKGDDAPVNAEILTGILQGQGGPRRDVVLLNAAAALWVGGAADDLGDGIQKARTSIDSGAALGRLEELIAFSRKEASAHAS